MIIDMTSNHYQLLVLFRTQPTTSLSAKPALEWSSNLNKINIWQLISLASQHFNHFFSWQRSSILQQRAQAITALHWSKALTKLISCPHACINLCTCVPTFQFIFSNKKIISVYIKDIYGHRYRSQQIVSARSFHVWVYSNHDNVDNLFAKELRTIPLILKLSISKKSYNIDWTYVNKTYFLISHRQY